MAGDRVLVDLQEITPYMVAGRALNGNIVDVPSIGIGATVVVAVQLLVPYVDTNYRVAAILVGSSTLLGGLSVVSTSVVDAQNVSVSIKNNALVVLSGGKLLVMAGHN